MKTIKIDYMGFWEGFNKRDNFIYDILSERYDVRISKDPDFLFTSIFVQRVCDYLKKDCVRILFAGEPFQADFNSFDYAIGFDHIDFPYMSGPKRYYRYPLVFLKKNED